MKKYIIILSILSKMIVAQNLSFDEILNLQTKKFEAVEEFLSARNWQFISSDLPTDDKAGIVTFSYGKKQMSDRALSFFYYVYSGILRRVSVAIASKMKYTEYVNRAKALGYKQYNTALEENKIIKVYRKGNIAVKFSTKITEGEFGDTQTYYDVLIMSFDDFIDMNPELFKPFSDK